MALNYQRNSYELWKAANKTYQDKETRFVFFPKEVLNHSFFEVQTALTKYKVALQKNKQTEIWIALCQTFVDFFDGDIRKLFDTFHNDVDKIREFVQKKEKRDFLIYQEQKYVITGCMLFGNIQIEGIKILRV